MSLDKYAIPADQAQIIISQVNAPREGKKDYNDPRFWKPSIRDSKDARDQRPDEYQALVRILPRGFDTSKPFAIQQMEHFFKEEGIWFSKKCRRTLGDKEICPVCEANWKVWNLSKDTRDDNLKNKAKARFPKESYICNVYIIKDIVHPENDGKVMLWKLTKNMYDIITSAMKPPQQKKSDAFGEESKQSAQLGVFIPYDVINGKNLVVHLTRDPKTTIPSYNSSYWHKPEIGPVPLAKTEEEIDNILKDCNDLMEFISDVPTVDFLVKELVSFQTKITNQSSNNVEGYNPIFQPAGAAPVSVKPPQGNSQDLFGNTVLKPLPNTVQVAPQVTQPVAEVIEPVTKPLPLKEATSPSPEDELPF